MVKDDTSVWLGGMRGPMRLAATILGAITLALVAYLWLGAMFGWSDVGMKEFLSPRSHPIVATTMIVAALALLAASIYLSDFRGTIETRPTGPFDIASLVCARLSMIAIVLVVIVMMYEVVSRYVFEDPTLWANELALWIAGFLFLLAGLYAMQQRSHIRIYIVYDIMPRWMQKTSDVISVLLIWTFALALIWGGYNEARDKFLRWETFGTAWDPPIPGTLKSGILFIILLVSIQALSNLIADWNRAPEHHSPLDDIDETEIENIKATLKD